ncbi:MAG: cytosine permease [Sedimentitalea sp.]|uniref:cytosine permease n=1 Tax=Sedimentitalea sp. TaxID=2048915 RepID=UPI003264F7D5
MSSSHIEHDFDSLPIPLSARNWGGWAAAAVAATAGIASWSFVVGGFTAYYVDAREGTATMIAGALIGQLLVTLSQVPAVTKYGIETLGSTKAQLGVKGSIISLIVQYMTLIGWNLVLTIFLGRAVASVLVALGAITEAKAGSAAITSSLVGALLVWILLQKGSDGVKSIGVIVASCIVVLMIWMYYLLFANFTMTDILAAEPLGPNEGGRLTNYTTAMELLMVSTLGWWAYMGAMFRMLNHAGKGALPSMVSLGFGWAAAGLIGLYSALAAGEADPTIWILSIAGPTAGVFVLVFVALANLGSTLVGAHAAALGVGQFSPITQRMPWNAKVATAIVPMAVIIVLFPGAFYDNIGTFMAFIGIVIAPMIGIQIVDWFLLHRLDSLHVPSLYWHDRRSRYWYQSGYNVVGIVALACGSLTYVYLLDPLTFVPNNWLFQYTTATLPAAVIGGLVYWVGTNMFYKEH